MKDIPTYNTVLPASVRYNHDLTPVAKLLYAEIAALTNYNGVCWASNGFFSDLFGVDVRTISRSIKSLVESNFIVVKQEGKQRTITLTLDKNASNMDKNASMVDKNVVGGRQKCLGTLDKNVQQNNIYLINKFNNLEKEDVEEKETVDYDYFVSTWNDKMIKNCPTINKIVSFSDSRKKKLDEIVAIAKDVMKRDNVVDKPERFILKAVQREYERSDYLAGKGKFNKAIGVDFVLTTEYFMKLLEGAYRTIQDW